MGDEDPSPQHPVGSAPPNAYSQPPTNPVDGQNSALGNNVVRDLMRVYESLTQSSTPQVAPDAEGNAGTPGPGFDPSQPAPHGYTAAQVGGQHGMPPTYPIPPSTYHMPGQTQYPPSQQQHGMPQIGGPQQPYPAYSQHPYMAGEGEHAPQHGYALPGQEQGQHMGADQEDDAQELDTSQDSAGRSRRKRKDSDSASGSRGQKGRKKSKSTDGRWSKRFTWPEDLHRDFVSAIFDVGLKHSSPSAILEHMPKHEQVTTERIKSHLQKYRLHRVKSKKEFVSSYESSLRNFQNHGVSGAKTIAGGEVAAHLTYAELSGNTKKDGTAKPEVTAKADAPTPAVSPDAKSAATEALMLPQLTEAEKSSPIGAAMGYLMGLFFSLKQQLMVQRAMAAADLKNKGDAPVKDVFNSFVTGNQATEEGFPAGANNLKPAARTNISENNLMKREMQNQMALQNKMRALKQQELNKYKNMAGEGKGERNPISHVEDSEEALASHVQGAGEAEGNDGAAPSGRARGLSFGASDEFWNTDVVDEQLFEFLMNN